MQRPVVNPGTLIWSGEHWVIKLRDNHGTDTGRLSLYSTRCSSAGEGTVAFVDIPGEFGQYVFTDNKQLYPFIYKNMVNGNRATPFKGGLPLFNADISRDGDIRGDPGWVIKSGDITVSCRWRKLLNPVIAEGYAPTFTKEIDIFSILFFADKASMTFNGKELLGQPYMTDIWRTKIGGNRSSCVFAIGETLTRVATD